MQQASSLHLQAVGILQSSSDPKDLAADAAALTDLASAEQLPVPSRLKAIAWLLELVGSSRKRVQLQTEAEPGKGSQAKLEGRVNTPALSKNEEGGKRADTEGQLPQETYSATNSQGRSLWHSQVTVPEILSLATEALISATKAKDSQVRAAAARSLLAIASDQNFELNVKQVYSMMGLIYAGLSDTDPDAQHYWHQLLFALCTSYEVSCILA